MFYYFVSFSIFILFVRCYEFVIMSGSGYNSIGGDTIVGGSSSVARSKRKIPLGIGLILGANMGLMLMAMVRESNASIVQRL